jgi:hypothetical protein
MTINIKIDNEDLYTRLISFIEDQEFDRAVESLSGLLDLSKLQILSLLILGMMRNLTNDFAHDSFIETAVERAFDLDQVINHTYDLFHAINLSGEYMLDIDRDVIRNYIRSRDIAVEVAHALNLANSRYRSVTRARRIIQFVRLVLNDLAGVPQNIEKARREQYIEFSDLEKLTPRILTDRISPYLDTVVQLQQSIDRLNNVENDDIDIVSITHQSPVIAALAGVVTAFGAIAEYVLPERNRLALEQKAADIAKTRAEAAGQELQNQKSQDALGFDRELREIEVAMKRAELEEKLLILAEKKMELLLRIYERYAPNVPPEKRIEEAARLLPTFDRFFTMPEVKFLDPPK